MGSDKFLDRSVQTLSGALKNKHVQSDAVITVDAGLDWSPFLYLGEGLNLQVSNHGNLVTMIQSYVDTDLGF